MKIHLHKNATTTPAQRAYIQKNAHLSVSVLAEKTGVSKTTIRRWQKRMDVYDRPHTPKRIKTALSPIDEIKVIICRMAFRAGLDDLHQIAESFFKVKCSRASLNRCLQRYRISRMPKLKQAVPFDLKNYTGTYFYYNRFHLPAFMENQPPVILQTLLDCSFRTIHAQFSDTTNAFISDHLRNFPLKVTGIIYNDPVKLALPNIEIQNPDTAIQQIGRTFGLSCFHMDSLHGQTISLLNSRVQNIIDQPDHDKKRTAWDTNQALAKQVQHYNFELPLGFLKHKTPYQAMQAYYTHFPNSFQHKPTPMAQ